jgi:hypothetical protein
MINFIRKHALSLLIISILINCAGLFYAARKIYIKRLYSSERNLIADRYSSILKYDSLPPEKEIDKTIVLNTLADRFGYSSYLEIGQGMAEDNLDHIKCMIRIGVDPDPACNAAYCVPSDEFFEMNKAKFDLIFIDGLHHSDQVYRDILNSLDCLNDNGTIVVHDCNPINEGMQAVPRRQDHWTGDVWKAWARLRSERSDLEMFVLKNGNGCGVIRAGEQATIKLPNSLDYRFLDENRHYILNFRTVNQFLVWLKRQG